jgi:hypothetical protein
MLDLNLGLDLSVEGYVNRRLPASYTTGHLSPAWANRSVSCGNALANPRTSGITQCIAGAAIALDANWCLSLVAQKESPQRGDRVTHQPLDFVSLEAIMRHIGDTFEQ